MSAPEPFILTAGERDQLRAGKALPYVVMRGKEYLGAFATKELAVQFMGSRESKIGLSVWMTDPFAPSFKLL